MKTNSKPLTAENFLKERVGEVMHIEHSIKDGMNLTSASGHSPQEIFATMLYALIIDVENNEKEMTGLLRVITNGKTGFKEVHDAIKALMQAYMMQCASEIKTHQTAL